MYSIYALLAAFAMGIASCGGADPDDLDNIDQNPVFPKLDTFMPEDDDYRQTKSDKRGMCTLFKVPEMPEMLGSGISWCYNWSHNQLPARHSQALKDNGIVFYPMVWNAGFSASDLASHIAADPKANYILGYNEPNLEDQAEMTPSQAAESWPGLVAESKRLKAKLIAPAVNYGTLPGYNDPIKWYDEFFAHPDVSLDDVHAIAIHCYMPGAEQVKNFIRMFKKYGKPIWLTEFESGEAGSEASQINYMIQLCSYLEADPAIEKYAWFMDNTGSNNTAPHWPMVTIPEMGGRDSYVTDLGIIYSNMSALDKTTWYNPGDNIPAEHFSGQCVEETAAGDSWKLGILPRVTTDMMGTLEIHNFVEGNWAEYNVNLPKTSKYRLDIRYACLRDAAVTFSCSGVPDVLIVLPKTGAVDEWATMGVEVVMKSGKHTFRLTGEQGNPNFNWFRLTAPKSK